MDDLLEKEGYKLTRHLSIWEKSYWYLRFLVDTNRYGALGANSLKLEAISTNIVTTYKMLKANGEREETMLLILDSVFQQTLLEKMKEGKKKVAYEALHDHLKVFLLSSRDYVVFALTIREMLIPTNSAVKQVPSKDATDFALKYGKAILDSKGEEGLATIIRDWDIFTETISLNKERDIIVELASHISKHIESASKSLEEELNEQEQFMILTGVCQEFERRVGQKRKQRAGKDLESAIEFILGHFKIRTSGGPEHFTAGLEVDNWVKDKNGWYIGISLKRTLRERWKQTNSSDLNLLNKHKILHIIHILNNDADLSDSTITELGAHRHLFFLADGSNALKEKRNHPVLRQYLFPMSELISVVKSLIENSKLE